MSNTRAKRELDDAASNLKRAAQQLTWEQARECIRRAGSSLEDAARYLDND